MCRGVPTHAVGRSASPGREGAGVIGALVGLMFSGGLVLMADGWRRSRRPPLVARVAPYIRDLRGAPSAASSTDDLVTSARRRLTRAAATIGETVGSSVSVRRRLIRLGVAPDVEAFRMTQALWALGGFAAGFALSLAVASRGAPIALLLFLCFLGATIGLVGCDHRLSARVRERERLMVREFPAISDLLALAIAAGESPTAAVDRVARATSGPLGDELLHVLADIRSGIAVPVAFQSLAQRTGIPSLSRFAEAVAVAVERGTPLIDVLHAQSEDVRDASRRELVETAGRREVLMMVPVVFLVLPVTVIFAFYPGWIGLSLSSGP
ncbi:pilus assembly protein TadB [Aeromicrobium camelliae]|uniref:Pilus assembly protein TadB n=1 Tax=Aeromicrobium camelliae TaxID=1538144 RepID=A0A3N6YK71_9ACTN|nr:pilus assembly protein TadB [Aeromicrobium camelliae]